MCPKYRKMCPWWNWIPLEPPTLPVRVRAPADTPKKDLPHGKSFFRFAAAFGKRNRRVRKIAGRFSFAKRSPPSGYTNTWQSPTHYMRRTLNFLLMVKISNYKKLFQIKNLRNNVFRLRLLRCPKQRGCLFRRRELKCCANRRLPSEYCRTINYLLWQLKSPRRRKAVWIKERVATQWATLCS